MTATTRRRFLLALTVAAVGGAGLGGLVASQQPQAPPTSTPVPAAGRRIRSARLATRFDGVAGVPVWSPDGSAMCVQHSRAGARQVAVYDTGSWTMRFAAAGSLPAWAPDSNALAVIDPFPRTIPVSEENRVRVLDARTGVERRSVLTRTASIGWSQDNLLAAVGGEIARLDGPAAVTQSACAGGCGLVLWSFDARYVAASDARSDEGRYQLREAATGRILADLGASRGLIAWASASPTLIGGFERGPLAWRPRGIEDLTLPQGYMPVVSSPEGEVVIASTTGGDVLRWTQLLTSDGRTESIELPLASIRGVTWSPGGRFLTSIPPTFGPSSQLEVFELELA